MQTITHTRGTTVGDPLTLTDDAGEPLDLTGCTVTAHVRVGAECRQLTATIADPLLGEAWLDWETLALPPRVYGADLTVTWPDGAVEPAGEGLALNIVGNC